MKIIQAAVMICVVCFAGLAQAPAVSTAFAMSAAAVQEIRVTQRGFPTATAPTEAPFVIGPEDVLEINVWKEPDLMKKVTVRSDGKISLPLLNEIQAGGLTIRQLADQITERLTRFLGEPIVTVDVVEVHSQVVYVLGAIAKQGAYTISLPMTLIDLLARAGGLAEFAKAKEIVVVRQEGDTMTQYTFDYESFFHGKSYRQNILLRNGDKIFVP